MKELKVIWKYCKKVKWLLLGGVFFMIGDVQCGLLIIYLQKWILSDIFEKSRYSLLLPMLYLYVALIIVSITFGLVGPYILLKVQAILRKLMYERLLNAIYKIPTAEFLSEHIGKYVNYFSNDVLQASYIFIYLIPEIALQLSSVIATLFYLSFFSLKMLPVVFIITSIYVLLQNKFGKQLKNAKREVAEQKSKVVVCIEEGISSTREIIANNRMEWENQKIRDCYNKYFEKIKNEIKITNRSSLFTGPIEWTPRIIILVLGGAMVLQGSLSIGTMVISYQFISSLMNSASNLFSSVIGIKSRLAFLERVDNISNISAMEDGKESLNKRIDSIKFKNVLFKYPNNDEDVLKGMSFDIPIGKKVAIVGTSGGGKSTIAQLFARFYSPNKGAILINRVPLNEFTKKDWLKKIAIAFQDAYLFPDTIRNNISMGRNEISEEELIKVCKITQIYNYIQTLPNKFDTILGERGANLSGGQRQRIILARALLKNPEILLIDEGTSALDLHTEIQIMDSIDCIRNGKTTIIIAHRLSTVENADYIIVVDKGIIAESGSHSELIRNGKIYNKLIQAQRV